MARGRPPKTPKSPSKNVDKKTTTLDGIKLSSIESIEELETYASMADEPPIPDEFEFDMVKHIDPIDGKELTTLNGGELPKDQVEPEKCVYVFREWSIIGVNYDKKVNIPIILLKLLHKRGILPLDEQSMSVLNENINSLDKLGKILELIKTLVVKHKYNVLSSKNYALLPDGEINYKSLINYVDGSYTFKPVNNRAELVKQLVIIFFTLVKQHKLLNIPVENHKDFGIDEVRLFTQKNGEIQLTALLQFIPYFFWTNSSFATITKDEYYSLNEKERELIHAKK
jgi:hypothetical protein